MLLLPIRMYEYRFGLYRIKRTPSLVRLSLPNSVTNRNIILIFCTFLKKKIVVYLIRIHDDS